MSEKSDFSKGVEATAGSVVKYFEDEVNRLRAENELLKNRPLSEHPLIIAACQKHPDGWDLTFNGSTVDDENSLWSAGSVEDIDGKTPEEALKKLLAQVKK